MIVKLQTSRSFVSSSNPHDPAQDREPAPEPGVEDGDDGFQSFHNQWTPMLGVDFDDDRDTGTTEAVTVFNHVFVEEVDYDKEGDTLHCGPGGFSRRYQLYEHLFCMFWASN